MEVFRVVVAAAFGLLGLLTLVLWLRRRSRPSAWLAWAFGTLAGSLIAGRIAVLLPEGPGLVLERTSRVALLAFPYLLFRFAASFEPPWRRIRAAAAGVAAATLVATALVPSPEGGTRPLWFLLYVLGALTVWTGLSAWVVWWLWRSGESQAAVARRRMRILAVAAAVLNAGLIAAGGSATAGDLPVVIVVVYCLALVSAGLFFLGFAPPAPLRVALRQRDERALWRAERALVAAGTREEVIDGLLPHVSHLLGGGPVLYVDRSGAERSYGDLSPEQRERFRADHVSGEKPVVSDHAVALPLRAGRLGVASGPFTPLFGNDEVELTAWLGSLMDLALERVELHERERWARTRAEHLTSELESLVYGITHDLRNPIVSVLGYLDCVEEDHAHRLDGDGRHFLRRMRTNAEYMDRLIGDLLALSRVGRVPDDPEPVNLTDVAEEVAEELGQAQPGAAITVDSLPVVTINRVRARQLLTNLVGNALAHGGRPDVKVRLESMAAQREGLGCFAVIDNGRGIPEAYRGKVFGLFERLDQGDKSAADGTGIGLAMCQRIVSQAGGSIWVAGNAEGADVRVQLPLAAESPVMREPTR